MWRGGGLQDKPGSTPVPPASCRTLPLQTAAFVGSPGVHPRCLDLGVVEELGELAEYVLVFRLLPLLFCCCGGYGDGLHSCAIAEELRYVDLGADVVAELAFGVEEWGDKKEVEEWRAVSSAALGQSGESGGPGRIGGVHTSLETLRSFLAVLLSLPSAWLLFSDPSVALAGIYNSVRWRTLLRIA